MKKIAITLLTFAALSCNNNNASSNTNAADSTEKKADVPATGSTDGTKITVQLTGGDNAGSYTATSKDPTCSMGLTGEKSFGNQYSEDNKGDKELSSLQLIVDDYDAAKAGTDKFMVTVGFGKLLNGKSYTINGRDHGTKEGGGKLTIKESGNEKIVTIDGKTSDGVSISATIDCNSVIGAGGQ